ncbi:MAG: ADP-dependent NAD(P)H-hydrate dehydratase [Frankiaceae bacterium]|nr:ADP-dependent NAD(P)H-hydrate dehydratase [Frankiaceae bacterium]MDQ1635659.1 ADP-dependent NAD(P)H-hydrate dehydratase [Frankiaceae bacterium]MDQ1650660.1 ADP-dependent NAD(P)H-hydrate dehydratase [Frankiaceae bacterium]
MTPTSQQDPAEGGTAAAPAVITPSMLRDWPLPQPGSWAGKDVRGRVLVAGGSQSTPGAVLLAGVAALRVGAGKLQMATAETAATGMAIAVPESGVAGLPLDENGALGAEAGKHVADEAGGMSAILLGVGMTDPDATRQFLEAVLPGVEDETALVLDALALTCGAISKDSLARFGGRVIITPNEAEMARILDDVGSDTDAEQASVLELAAEVAATLGVIVAYEGIVATPDGRCWRDGTGNAGLGTSGSGDVLAGVAVGLLARGADPAQAAAWAVHLHGSAGDAMAATVGRLGFLAGELLDQVPRILASLEV